MKHFHTQSLHTARNASCQGLQSRQTYHGSIWRTASEVLDRLGFVREVSRALRVAKECDQDRNQTNLKQRPRPSVTFLSRSPRRGSATNTTKFVR